MHNSTRADPVHLYLTCRWHLSITVMPAQERNTYEKIYTSHHTKETGVGKEGVEKKDTSAPRHRDTDISEGNAEQYIQIYTHARTHTKPREKQRKS